MLAYVCFYRPRNVSLDNKCDEISKYAHYCSGDKYKDQHSGNPFFKIGIFTEEVSCIEQEAD